MEVEILMSTMNRKSIDELDLRSKNINDHCLIINQTDNEEIIEDRNNIKMINSKERGLSNSRNLALEHASGDMLVIADDDVRYVENYKEIIKEAFNELRNADVITFQMLKHENKLYKSYKDKVFKHNKITIRRVSSIEIVYKKRIKNSEVSYDPNFGLGARFTSGEENIFLLDLLKKGYNIYYYPVPIVYHEDETSASILTDRVAYSKGALFYRMYGKLFLFVSIIYILKKFKSIYKFGLFRFIKNLHNGYKAYKRKQK